MLDNSTIETLKAMHCSAMASELENQLNDSKTYGTLAFEEIKRSCYGLPPVSISARITISF